MANSSVLGSPTGPEGHWASAGGGWAQPFQRGWALVSDNGRGGMVTGPLLPYFTSHGFVNASGWPTANAVTDSKGTYQRFGSKDGSNGGTLMSSSSGTYRLKGGMEQMYFDQGLRSALGSLTGEEARWAASGGGWAQHFTGGWLLYKSSSVKGYVPASFPWPDLGKLGWPKGGPQSACGGTKIVFERGYAMQDSRWCPASQFAQPTTAIAAPPMPAALTWVDGGDAGINVMLLQRALGLSSTSFRGPMERITGLTATKLAQKRSSLGGGYSATLDLWLWNKLNIGVPWSLAVTPQQPGLPMSATAQNRIDAMTRFARGKTRANGYPYTYGSAGPNANSRPGEKYGYDCSGLVLAAMQYAGIQPRHASVRDDMIHPTKLTKALYNDSSLLHRPLSERRAGDLIYYTTNGASSGIGHVALYLGNNRVFDTENDGYEGLERTLWDPTGAGLSLYGTVSRPVS